MRRLDDAAVVFDPRSWQTHILPPAAVVIAEAMAEAVDAGRGDIATAAAAVCKELDVNPRSPDFVELLRMFGEIGILRR